MARLPLFLFALAACFLQACRHDTPKPLQPSAPAQGDNYPETISKIFIGKCATAGCHNASSYENAGGLLLDSWDHLFDGSNSGAVVVPYDIENSSLLYFINTHADLGPTSTPTMPLDRTPLSREEYTTMRDWIAKGAPDRSGNIPFASNADTRQKIYIAHQGCDLIGVIDGEKKVIMRYVKAGTSLNPETPNYIKTSNDGRYAYACFWQGDAIQKIDTRTDSMVANALHGSSYWKNLQLSPDGNTLLATNWELPATVVFNTSTMQFEKSVTGLQYPESIASGSSGAYYITERFGNMLCKLLPNGTIQKISIDGQPLTTTPSPTTPNPYRILMSKDGSKYFISCERTNEVRVFDAQTDALTKVIPVGTMPQEMAWSTSTPYLFVSCLNDTVSTGVVGTVYAINYNTYETKKIEGKFFQPHGIAVDDRNDALYVFSRNQDKAGPSPHHSSSCNGRNGFYTIIRLSTLQPYNNKRYEISVDPYSADTRFK